VTTVVFSEQLCNLCFDSSVHVVLCTRNICPAGSVMGGNASILRRQRLSPCIGMRRRWLVMVCGRLSMVLGWDLIALHHPNRLMIYLVAFNLQTSANYLYFMTYYSRRASLNYAQPLQSSMADAISEFAPPPRSFFTSPAGFTIYRAGSLMKCNFL
jgi:hypothetical protein